MKLAEKMNNKVIQFVQNAMSYALPVFLLQFVVYPLIAKKLGAEANGSFLAMIALNYMMANLTAGTLVNVRILRQGEYEKQKVRGDFNLLLAVFAVITMMVVSIGTLVYGQQDVTVGKVALSVTVAWLFLYHDYIVAQYRIEHRFGNILVNNLLLCGGYLLGIACLYWVAPLWQIVFIVPYVLTAIYDLKHTDYIREGMGRTVLLKGTCRHYLLLLGSTVLGTLVTYGDRLILYPVLDGASISVFVSAQLIGKMLQMISTPVSTFLLAHLVKKEQLSVRVKVKWLLAAVAGCGVMYAACVVVGGSMLWLLYPEWADLSIQYVPITAANGLVRMLNVLLNVFVLRYCAGKYQVVKSAVYLAAYVLFSFVLLNLFGLYGFAAGNLAASVMEFGLLGGLLVAKKVVRFGGEGKKA